MHRQSWRNRPESHQRSCESEESIVGNGFETVGVCAEPAKLRVDQPAKAHRRDHASIMDQRTLALCPIEQVAHNSGLERNFARTGVTIYQGGSAPPRATSPVARPSPTHTQALRYTRLRPIRTSFRSVIRRSRTPRLYRVCDPARTATDRVSSRATISLRKVIGPSPMRRRGT